MGKRFNIKFKLISIVASLLLILSIVSIFSIKITKKILTDSITKNSNAIAYKMLKDIEKNISIYSEQMEFLTWDKELVRFIYKSNDEMQKLENRKLLLNERNKAWVNLKEKEKNDLIRSLNKNSLSLNIQRKYVDLYMMKKGYSPFKEIIVTNKFGVNVAQLNKTSDYIQSEEIWWQEAKINNKYIGKIEYNEYSRSFIIPMAFSIRGNLGEFIGVVKSGISAFDLINEVIKENSIYINKEVLILNEEGRLIYSTEKYTFLASVKEDEFYKKIENGEKIFKIGEFLYCVSDYKNSANRVIILKYKYKDIMAPVLELESSLIKLNISIIFLSTFILSFLIRGILSPLLALKSFTKKMAVNKEFDTSIIKVRKDEIGDLEETFIEMSKELRTYYEELHLFKNLAENSTQGMLIISMEGELKYINKVFKKVFSTGKEIKINGENFGEILIKERVQKVLDNGNFKKELKIEVDNKKRIFIENLFPILNDKGEIIYIGDIVSEITEEREISETLEEALNDAEKANKAKSNFLANMSHELRTPMNGILGISEMMMKYDAENLSYDQLEGLRLINNSGDKLLEIINDILDIAKIEAGKLLLKIQLLNFIEMLSDVESIIKKLIESDKDKKGKVEFFIDKSTEIPEYFYTDKKILHQILMNLLGNAYKFTNSGKIVLEIYSDNDKLNFEVTDTGIGIKNENLEYIFEKFTQIDDNLTKQYKGTGLGLNICKSLVEKLGGEISIKSKYGVGTTVKFSIKNISTK